MTLDLSEGGHRVGVEQPDMGYSNGERRSRVHRLLEGGVPRKLMRGEQDRAMRAIHDAYHWATTPTPLESPWPEVCAYRLGHLLLRQAPLDLATQQEAERLFAQASHLEALGPWPCLYRLAILLSLGKTEQLPALWEDAFLRLGQNSGPLDSTAAGLRSNEVTGLELMACAAGLFSRLPRLSGLGLPMDDDQHPIWAQLFAGQECAWRMLGPDLHLSQVAYPYCAARVELESLCAVYPGGFFFILSDDGRAQFWQDGQWLAFAQLGLLELLATALRTRKYDNASLAEVLDVSDGALRVRKVQLHHLLRSRFPNIGEVAPYSLNIFGIVQHGAFASG